MLPVMSFAYCAGPAVPTPRGFEKVCGDSSLRLVLRKVRVRSLRFLCGSDCPPSNWISFQYLFLVLALIILPSFVVWTLLQAFRPRLEWDGHEEEYARQQALEQVCQVRSPGLGPAKPRWLLKRL